MLRLLSWSVLIFSILLSGFTVLLQENYQTDVSSNWVLYSYEDTAKPVPLMMSLYRLNLETGKQDLLAGNLTHNGSGVIHQAEWSPDGRWIYFKATDKAGHTHLYRQNLASNTPQIVIPNWDILPTGDFRDTGGVLRWTPDNQWIIHQRIYETTIYSKYDDAYHPVQVYALYRMRPDGSDVQRLTKEPTNFDEYVYQVTISPDGQWLYIRQSGAFYRLNLTTQIYQSIPVSEFGLFIGWSTDGQWLYFTDGYGASTQRDVRRIKADGSISETVLPLAEDAEAEAYAYVRWLEPGVEMLYRVNGEYRSLNLETNTKHYLISGDTLTFPSISPDRKWIYVTDSGSGFYQLPLDKDKQTDNTDWLVRGESFRILRWAEDQSGFYYQISEDNNYQLYYLDIPSRQTTHVVTIGVLREFYSSYLAPNAEYLVAIARDLCRVRLNDGDYQCLTDLPDYTETLVDWAPPFAEKPWHIQWHLGLVGGLIVGCGGLTVYLRRNKI